MNIKECAKNYNLKLTEEQIQEIEKVMRRFENKIKLKGDRLPTLGFGIPNLLKIGEVGYFPEQFLVDVDLQGKTASEIARYFISTGIDVDGDFMGRWSDRDDSKIKYFVDLKHNTFYKILS